MTKFEFACNLFGYEPVVKGIVSQDRIDMFMDDWKHSGLPFHKWAKLLKTRG